MRVILDCEQCEALTEPDIYGEETVTAQSVSLTAFSGQREVIRGESGGGICKHVGAACTRGLGRRRIGGVLRRHGPHLGRPGCDLPIGRPVSAIVHAGQRENAED